jgi:dihydroorotate dehydrogenase
MMFDPFTLLAPCLHALDPETAHALTLRALSSGIVPGQRCEDDPILATTLFGRRLAAPVGLAAGFDKNARVYARMFAHGFSFVEVGGVTPLPQAGNARPRVFRLRQEGAVINRMGFPNEGAHVVLERMRRVGRGAGMVGVNLANNAESGDPAADFVLLVERFAPHVDYLTLDISCPNTKNGQMFLEPTRLRELLLRVKALGCAVPLAAKLSPDIENKRLEEVIAVLLEARIDALIITNTTAQRLCLTHAVATEVGGLSGRPLFRLSTRMLAEVTRLTGKAIPLIGVGGIASGADAYVKIRAGACAIQLYTALIYAGTALVPRIRRELAALLRRDGFSTLTEAVGVDVR